MKTLYTITEKDNAGPNEIKLVVALNAEHEIFGAHFPGDPILPGVCMLQIVRETLKETTGQKLYLKKGRNIKFLAKVNPHVFPVICIDISLEETGLEGEFQVKAQSWFGETVFFKFSGVFSASLVPA